MTRVLLIAFVLVGGLALATGSPEVKFPAEFPPSPEEVSPLCKSAGDAGTKVRPHGLLMVADRVPALPCAQGG